MGPMFFSVPVAGEAKKHPRPWRERVVWRKPNRVRGPFPPPPPLVIPAQAGIQAPWCCPLVPPHPASPSAPPASPAAGRGEFLHPLTRLA